jgi:putative ABC transport system permease protein
MLLYLLRRRLRTNPAAELLAGLGVAVGVALVFGVLLANASLTSSAEKLVHGLAGGARFELSALSPQGFPQALASRAGSLGGVEVAAPVLRRNVTLVGPHGTEAVQLIGLSPSVEDLGGVATQELADGAQLLGGGLGLPSGVAEALGVRRNSVVTLQSAGRARRVRVRVVLGGSLAALAASPAAVAVLPLAQSLSGSAGLVSEVLIKPLPGKTSVVEGELRALAGSRLQVRPADAELRLLNVATAPNRQSTSLFTAIAVMIGFLLALNAMLLTVPERRRFIAELRLQGYAPRQIALLLSFQALALGLIASLAGIALGYLFSRLLFQRVPDFLTAAFPIGAEETLAPLSVLAALGCGMLAASIASLLPLIEPRMTPGRDRTLGGEQARSEIVSGRTVATLGLASLGLIGFAIALALLWPTLTILSGVALAIAVVCLAPIALAGMVRLLPAALERVRSAALIVALQELRAVTMRAIALSAIVALAVYGGIAIGGAREDLLRGIAQATTQYFGTASVWVTSGKDVFNMNAFPAAGPARALSRVPGVASVRVYRGGLLDVGDRRMWVRARPSADGSMLEPSQLLHGDRGAAEAAIRSGAGAAVSSAYAAEAHLRLGGRLTLPTPAGRKALRLVAITTNSGWPPGTITLDAADYARWWGATQAAALEVSLKPGVSPAVGRREVQAALVSAYPGLLARTAAQRAAQSAASAREGLRTLQEISTLLLLAAALAVASALAASIWQRRRRLAALKVQGYGSGQLWGSILIESGVTVAAGSLLGAALGIGGHALASRFLALSTGFPAPFALGPVQVLLTVLAFCAIALSVIALPGMAAAGVSPRAALQE